MKHSAKQLLTLLTTLFISFSFTACDEFVGEGETIQFIPTLDAFNSLNINIPCKINVIYADTAFLKIKAQQNVYDMMEIVSKNNVLSIDFLFEATSYIPVVLTFCMPETRTISTHDISTVNLYTIVNNESRFTIDNTGEATYNFENSITCHEIRIENSSLLTLKLNKVSTDKIIYKNTDESTCEIIGHTDYLYIEGDNKYIFNGYELNANLAEVSAKGEGIIELGMIETIEVDLSDKASMYYLQCDDINPSDSTNIDNIHKVI